MFWLFLKGKDFYDKNYDYWKKGRKCSKALYILTIIQLVYKLVKFVFDLRARQGEQKGCCFSIMSIIDLGVEIAAIVLAIIAFADFNKIKKIYKFMPDVIEDVLEDTDYKNYKKCWKMALANMILELAALALAVFCCCCLCGCLCFAALLGAGESAGENNQPQERDVKVKQSVELQPGSNNQMDEAPKPAGQETNQEEITNLVDQALNQE